MYWLIAAIIIGAQIHVLTMALSCLVAGVKIKKISIGYGPKVFAKGLLEYKLLIIGGFVTMQSKNDLVNKMEGDSAKDEYQPGSSFEDKNYFVRVLIALSGCAALLLIAWLLLGNTVFQELFYIMNLIVEGALSPFEKGGVIVFNLFYFLQVSAAPIIIGMAFTTLAAANLLPIPSLNGAQFIVELISIESIKEKFLIVGILCVIYILVAWLLAFGKYFIYM